jgi:hypothetical protein
MVHQVALVEALLEMDIQAALQHLDKEMLVEIQIALAEMQAVAVVQVVQVVGLLALTPHLLVMVERRLFHQLQVLLSNMQVAAGVE